MNIEHRQQQLQTMPPFELPPRLRRTDDRKEMAGIQAKKRLLRLGVNILTTIGAAP